MTPVPSILEFDHFDGKGNIFTLFESFQTHLDTKDLEILGLLYVGLKMSKDGRFDAS